MLDFVQIRTTTKVSGKKGFEESTVTVYPEFIVGPSEDLMVRGGAFYAVWDEDAGLWSKDPSTVARIVDAALDEKRDHIPEDMNVDVKYLRVYSTKKWEEFLSYAGSMPDNYHELDSTLTFSDDEVQKCDYVSKRLPYPLKAGSIEAYDSLMSVLYDPIERQKLEWAIGSVISGDSVKIQKFVVLYGAAGSGKSTVLNIIQMLFEGYYNVFEAKSLTSASDNFALEMFRNNPLVSVQHDGDLSRIEDNTKLNSIVSHEEMVVNEKRKTKYVTYFRTFLFMGTNRPVKITEARAGITRRLIDVRPSGQTVPFDKYQVYMAQIRFELSGIAYHCLKVYLDLGMSAYDNYRPLEMMSATNDFYNFVEENLDVFKQEGGTTLMQAWAMYKKWAEDANVKYPLSKRAMKEELKGYFRSYDERRREPDGTYRRNVFRDINPDKFKYAASQRTTVAPEPISIDLSISKSSLFDKMYADCPAQLANDSGTPSYRWENVITTLKDIDPTELHYVKVPENHIVIDFDIKDEDGEKDLNANLRAASKWPTTYTELSKSGKGVHLHYIYDGDVTKLSPSYSDNIEIKVFKGNSSLRRKLTRCNNVEVATLSSGLPLKKGGKRQVINFEGLKNEKALRTILEKNLRKEIHPGTKPSIDFIYKILEDAYSSGMPYDVTDMRPAIAGFASKSSHHALYCIKLVNKMHFHSEEPSESESYSGSSDIVFYDVEVFPNLFVVVWKKEGQEPVKMINPTPADIEILMNYRLVGFNNRRYDNHILYARLLGFTNEQLYNLSQSIINGSKNAMFREAYGISYTDVYDFSSKKQSLKKFEIELGLHHQELGLPWDQPVPENKWEQVASYCVNDVVATEETFKARYQDFVAREVLADLSGLTVNDPTRSHATRIIFGNDRKPQSKFVYTDLSEYFPGYKFEAGHSSYRGEDPGEGGYVYAEPGMYENVTVLDIASMHPNSLIQLNLFGDEYTKNFKDILDARLAIKHKDFDKAKSMLNGVLAPYLKSPEDSDKLAYALKIIINSVYGYTSAKFDCEFKDPRNVDNIVAKRGALFMIDLKHAVQEQGYIVAHIKTDSIKIPNADDKIIQFVIDYGKKWGYSFECEAVYDKMCLVNNAVYIAKEKDGHWTATGTQFAVPYVFKTLFSGEKVEFEDLCETKTVTGSASIYLDMNESLPEGSHDYKFVGKAGQFTPILPGQGGGLLVAIKEDRTYSPPGTKGYRWLESETVRLLDKFDAINMDFYDALADEAKKTISQYGDFENFVKE